MGIDYGKKRIGISVSDPLGITAQPIETLENDKGLVGNISRIVKKYDIKKIIIGLPKTLKGEIAEAAKDIRKTAELLKKHLKLPVVEYDERLSTAQTEKMLISADVKRKKRRDVIDKMAAALILQDYMDSLRRE